jgi:SAM-dependent methyltransferase
MNLLDDDALKRSSVVANCQMNRQRTLTGSNGYAKELRLNPLDVLLGRAGAKARWLDLCCGEGKALMEAAQIIYGQGLDDKFEIVGVDLVAPPCPSEPGFSCVRLIRASLTGWQPTGRFDLITCVHGLHYIGDKLAVVLRAASWLADDGQFVANLDLNNIKLAGGRVASRVVAKELRQGGLEVRQPEEACTLLTPDRGPVAVSILRCRRSGRAELHEAARRGLVLRLRGWLSDVMERSR